MPTAASLPAALRIPVSTIERSRGQLL